MKVSYLLFFGLFWQIFTKAMAFPTLNLPTFAGKIKESSGKLLIFDIIRRKYLVLTPEEWVRQHFVHYLIEHLQYPASLISLETGLHYNTLLKRSDILVYDRTGKPFLLVECKAWQMTINQPVLDQALRYNAIWQAPFLALTNGLTWPCWHIDWEKNDFNAIENLPNFPV